MSAYPVVPSDRYSRHRFHWIKGNDFEVWEWLRNGTWLRPGLERPISDYQAKMLGFIYVSEAVPPMTTPMTEPAEAVPTVDLWLMQIGERETAYLLSSDHAEVWVSKKCCRQLQNGQWRMPLSVALEGHLEMGAT